MMPFADKRKRREKKFVEAAGRGDAAYVLSCLKKGIDVDCTDGEDGNSALHLATRNGQHEMVKLLVREKAEVNIRRSVCRETPLHYAAIQGHIDVSFALLKGGAEVDAKNTHHNTPLHFAARGGRLGVVKLLLEYGANPDATTKLSKSTALHCALMDHYEWLRIQRDDKVILRQKINVLRYLLQKGADPSLRNKANKTPLDMALVKSDSYRDAVQILLQALGEKEVLVDAKLDEKSDTETKAKATERRAQTVKVDQKLPPENAKNVDKKGTRKSEELLQQLQIELPPARSKDDGRKGGKTSEKRRQPTETSLPPAPLKKDLRVQEDPPAHHVPEACLEGNVFKNTGDRKQVSDFRNQTPLQPLGVPVAANGRHELAVLPTKGNTKLPSFKDQVCGVESMASDVPLAMGVQIARGVSEGSESEESDEQSFVFEVSNPLVDNLKSAKTYEEQLHAIQKVASSTADTMPNSGEASQAILEADGVAVLLKIVREYPDSKSVQQSCCCALGNLSSMDISATLPGLSYVLKAMKMFPNELEVQYEACRFLMLLTDNHIIGNKVSKKGGHAAILTAMRLHSESERLQQVAMCSLRNLGEYNVDLTLKHGALATIIRTMGIHTEALELQEYGCRIIRLAAESHPVAKIQMKKDGVISVIEVSMAKHSTSKELQLAGKLALEALDFGTL